MSVKIMFNGRLGADAETVTTGATPFISCRVAVDETFNKEKTTRWISVSADASRYKNMAQYLKKGTMVSVIGNERVSTYTSKSGENGIDTRVWADSIEFVSLGAKQEGATHDDTQDTKNAQMTTGSVKAAKKAAPKVEEPVVDNSDDGDDSDLPF